MINGCDISHWQGSVQWPDMRVAGIRFAWCKASQGQAGRDKTWTAGRRKAAAQAGVRCGAYHFADLSQLPEANAQNFADAIGALSVGELLPALDVEEQGLPEHITADEIRAWCVRFAAAFNALVPTPLVLYTDHGTLVNRMNGGEGLQAAFPFLWLARYTGASDPGSTGAWAKWTVWQWTQTGKVSGVDGAVDLNRCASEDDLNAITIPDPRLAQPGG